MMWEPLPSLQPPLSSTIHLSLDSEGCRGTTDDLTTSWSMSVFHSPLWLPLLCQDWPFWVTEGTVWVMEVVHLIWIFKQEHVTPIWGSPPPFPPPHPTSYALPKITELYCFFFQQICSKVLMFHAKIIFQHKVASFLVSSVWVCAWFRWTALGFELKAAFMNAELRPRELLTDLRVWLKARDVVVSAAFRAMVYLWVFQQEHANVGQLQHKSNSSKQFSIPEQKSASEKLNSALNLQRPGHKQNGTLI